MDERKPSGWRWPHGGVAPDQVLEDFEAGTGKGPREGLGHSQWGNKMNEWMATETRSLRDGVIFPVPAMYQATL